MTAHQLIDEASNSSAFDTSRVWYHGTSVPHAIRNFKPSTENVELGPGFYVTSDRSAAAMWARGEHGKVYELYLRKGELFNLRNLWGGSRLATLLDLGKRLLARGHGPIGNENQLNARDFGLWVRQGLDLAMRHDAPRNAALQKAGYVGAYDPTSQIRGQAVIFNGKDVRAVQA